MVDENGLGDLMRDAGTRKPVQPDEQETLLRAAAEGDAVSVERLVAAFLPTVLRVAATRADEGLSLPDLVQEGSIGFLHALHEFPGSGEADFAAFAEARVAQQLSNAIETEAASVRDAQLLVTAAEDYARTEVILRRTLEREPTESELAEKLEWTVDRLRYVANVVAEARRRHDEELLAFVDPEALGLDDDGDDGDDDIASLN
jgi:RNA polymerase sigma factor (sigma-70 family)